MKIIQQNLMKIAWGGGKVQTICNYEVQKQGIKTKELDIRWNMFPMHKREMFGHNWQDGD